MNSNLNCNFILKKDLREAPKKRKNDELYEYDEQSKAKKSVGADGKSKTMIHCKICADAGFPDNEMPEQAYKVYHAKWHAQLDSDEVGDGMKASVQYKLMEQRKRFHFKFDPTAVVVREKEYYNCYRLYNIIHNKSAVPQNEDDGDTEEEDSANDDGFEQLFNLHKPTANTATSTLLALSSLSRTSPVATPTASQKSAPSVTTLGISPIEEKLHVVSKLVTDRVAMEAVHKEKLAQLNMCVLTLNEKKAHQTALIEQTKATLNRLTTELGQTNKGFEETEVMRSELVAAHQNKLATMRSDYETLTAELWK